MKHQAKSGSEVSDQYRHARLRSPVPAPRPSIQGSPPRYARGAHGVEPRRAGKVAFSRWAAEWSMQHPAWHGLGAGTDPRQVHRDG